MSQYHQGVCIPIFMELLISCLKFLECRRVGKVEYLWIRSFHGEFYELVLCGHPFELIALSVALVKSAITFALQVLYDANNASFILFCPGFERSTTALGHLCLSQQKLNRTLLTSGSIRLPEITFRALICRINTIIGWINWTGNKDSFFTDWILTNLILATQGSGTIVAVLSLTPDGSTLYSSASMVSEQH